MAKNCSICNKKIGLWSIKYNVKDGVLCQNCLLKGNFFGNADEAKMEDFLETQSIIQVQDLINNPEELEKVKAKYASPDHNKKPKAKCALCKENIYREDIELRLSDDSFICVNCIKKYKFSKDNTYTQPVSKAVKWGESHNIDDLKSYISQGKDFTDISIDIDKRIKEIEDFKKQSIKESHFYISQKERRILIDKTFLTDPRFVDADEIVSYDINEKGHNESKHHGVTRALVGAAIAGKVGAIIGASTGGKTNEFVDHLGLIINLTDGSNFEIKLLRGKTKINSMLAKSAYSELSGLISILESWKYQSSNDRVNQNADLDIPDEIKKYKNLADDGIISTEEFEVKKKQLLNL